MKTINTIKKQKSFYVKSVIIFFLVYWLLAFMFENLSLKINLIIFLLFLLCVGIYSNLSFKKYREKGLDLIQSGKLVKAKFYKYKIHINEVDGRSAVILILKDTQNNIFFETKILYVNNENKWLENQDFDVYVDKMNSSLYRVDTDKLIHNFGQLISDPSTEKSFEYKDQKVKPKKKQ